MPVKKTLTKKKTVRKNLKVEAVKKTPSIKKEKIKTPFKVKPVIVAVVVALLILIAIAYYFRNQFIVAVVNGQPISRYTLVRELEKQSGKTVLDSIITKTLVVQEAQKNGVVVTEQDIDDQIKKIEENLKSQGQNLADLLKMDGLSQKDFREQIKLQKMVEVLVGKEASVSAEEIDAYVKENKSYFPEGTSLEEMKKTAEQQLKQQNLSSKIQEWLANLREKAKIDYCMKY